MASKLAKRNLRFLEKEQKRKEKDKKNEDKKPRRSFIDKVNDSYCSVPTIANTKVKATVSAQIYEVLKCLQESPDRTFTKEDLVKYNNEIDFSNPELLSGLKNNKKINVEEGFGEVTFKYKPTYDLKDIEEVRDFFSKETLGIPKEKIIDSYRGIDDDLKVINLI